MATITGYTAAHMLELANENVIDGDVVGNNLILVTRGGTNINAGNVRGPTGASGPPGSGYIICTTVTRPVLTAGDEGKAIYETDTDLVRVWTGTRWKLQETIICTSTTRPAGVVAADEGVKIYETDTDLVRTWTGTRWKLQEKIVCTSTTRPTGLGALDEGVKIYETDTNYELIWTGSSWVNTVVSQFPVGFELMWPGDISSIPAGFLHENGAVLNRADYPLLFAILGTIWNQSGETALQFRLPDSRNRVVVGAGLAYALGQYGGEAAHALNPTELPDHIHWVSYRPDDGTSSGDFFPTAEQTTQGVVIDNTGGVNVYPFPLGLAHNNMQPYAVKNVIIRAG
jgi:microcystin-dependent protein